MSNNEENGKSFVHDVSETAGKVNGRLIGFHGEDKAVIGCIGGMMTSLVLKLRNSFRKKNGELKVIHDFIDE